jgi:hypothetical protein
MSVPVFVDVEPPPGCGCEECARRRLTDSVARDRRGRATVLTARVAVAAAASAVAAVPVPAAAATLTPGRTVAAHPRAALPAAAPLRLTRTQIMERARTWVAAEVPYSMTSYWKDGYRQDCSGYVSMAWGLNTNAWTGNLADYAVRVTKADLRPGDILLFHNPSNPANGSHTVVFGGWADAARTQYTAYEQTGPATRVRTTPYAYWSDSSKYVPYRNKYLVASAGSTSSAGASGSGAGSASRTPASPAPPVPPYPGAGTFRPGRVDDSVLALGRRLVATGFGAHYSVGPSSTWAEDDRRNVETFQRALGWSGRDADGVPGPETWRRLFS